MNPDKPTTDGSAVPEVLPESSPEAVSRALRNLRGLADSRSEWHDEYVTDVETAEAGIAALVAERDSLLAASSKLRGEYDSLVVMLNTNAANDRDELHREIQRGHDRSTDAQAARDVAVQALRGLVNQGGCRGWVGDNRCGAPAEFVLWGKLLPPEALGPRCYDHAAHHVGHRSLGDPSLACIDLRPAIRALASLPSTGGLAASPDLPESSRVLSPEGEPT